MIYFLFRKNVPTDIRINERVYEMTFIKFDEISPNKAIFFLPCGSVNGNVVLELKATFTFEYDRHTYVFELEKLDNDAVYFKAVRSPGPLIAKEQKDNEKLSEFVKILKQTDMNEVLAKELAASNNTIF